MKSTDHYKTLGLDRDATQQEIGAAFKKLAREHHPDLNDRPQAAEKFKEISEAYEVLKDAERRQQYDAARAGFSAGAGPRSEGGVHFDFGGGADFSDLFSSFMGGGGAGRGFGASSRSAGGLDVEDLFGGGFQAQHSAPRRRDVRSELTVELEDVALGRTRTITLEGARGKKRYDVKIPRGLRDGEQIRLAGQGFDGGDIYIKMNIAPHERFDVEGDDLVVKLPVQPWDAALGTKAKVSTLAGDVTVTVPPGISSGRRLRLRNKGLPRKGGGAGDLYAEVQITLPDDLSDEQKRLFEQLRQASRQRRKHA